MSTKYSDSFRLATLCLGLTALCGFSRAEAETTDECILRHVQNGDPQLTASAIKSICQPGEQAAVTPNTDSFKVAGTAIDRSIGPWRSELSKVVSVYQPNYFTWSSATEAPSSTTQDDGQPWGRNELMFQVSIKAPLVHATDKQTALFLAYTNRSWWQVPESSAPFREINHEPELFVRRYSSADLPGSFTLRGFDIGYNHQSNGRAGPSSRSWDRLFLNTAVQREQLTLGLRAWYQFPDSDSKNPRMYQYLGYGELLGIYAPERYWDKEGTPRVVYSLLLRPGTKKTSYEATWSWRPRWSSLARLYAQYFDGYGDSLIDYDSRTRRFGFGISLNEFDVDPSGVRESNPNFIPKSADESDP